MHWTGILLYSVVALWLIPGAFTHRTALVLFWAWIAPEAAWWFTADDLPLPLYVLTDAIAFTLILSWRTTLADTLVLSIYPSMWVAYVMGWTGQLDPRPLWWCLYWLALAQFVIAGPWPSMSRNRTQEGRRIFPKWRRLLVANQHIGYDHDK